MTAPGSRLQRRRCGNKTGFRQGETSGYCWANGHLFRTRPDYSVDGGWVFAPLEKDILAVLTGRVAYALRWSWRERSFTIPRSGGERFISVSIGAGYTTFLDSVAVELELALATAPLSDFRVFHFDAGVRRRDL